ncbi:MAG: hypothetical protein ACRD2Z_15565 [Thermoanaerobaculia bacterium]
MSFDLDVALAANARRLMLRVEAVKAEMLAEKVERERLVAEDRRRRDAEWRALNEAERAADRVMLGQLLRWKKDAV